MPVVALAVAVFVTLVRSGRTTIRTAPSPTPAAAARRSVIVFSALRLRGGWSWRRGLRCAPSRGHHRHRIFVILVVDVALASDHHRRRILRRSACSATAATSRSPLAAPFLATLGLGAL